MTENPAPVTAHTEACRIRMGRGNFSCSCPDEVVPPDGAAAALKELVQRWREHARLEHKSAVTNPARSKARVALLNSGDAKFLCADELEAALAALPVYRVRHASPPRFHMGEDDEAALPEARLPAEKTPEQLQHDLVYLLAHTQRERDTAVERYQLAEAKLNALPEARRQEE